MSQATLLFGATSILGFHLARRFPNTILPFISPGNAAPTVSQWPALKLEDPAWIESRFAQHDPDLLIYCHAICDVAKCETNPEWAYELNVQHVKRVLTALPEHTRLVYVSSDHVFGGDGVYTETSPVGPISVYGRTRVEAEQLVLRRNRALVIRTGLAIGRSPDGQTGHLDWLRYRTQRNLPMTIVADEHRSAVWVADLSTRVMDLAESDETGIRHVPATRCVSRVELADHLMHLLGQVPRFQVTRRHQRPVPHIGRVELASCYDDGLGCALPSVMDGSKAVSDACAI